MTIIAYRDGLLAADSAFNDTFVTSGDKLYKKDGHIIGFCGSVAEALVFVDWYFNRKKARKPDMAHEASWEALVVTAEHVTTWDKSLRPIPMEDRFYAIGSGASLAMGAMENGASAPEAAAIACRRDPYCREPVVVMSL